MTSRWQATVAIAVTLISWTAAQRLAFAGDWPTFRGDIHRRGIADEPFDPASLGEAWALRSDAAPQTAWGRPAKWDAYAGLRGLRAMRNYDAAFGMAIVGKSMFVASSSNDSVVCVDIGTGNVRWQFWADGPVRISPTIADARVYFGSDDGQVYCLDAEDGQLIWKFRPPIEEPCILHNGRMISRWPCRTGVLVHEGKAFCGFSLMPWDPSYICALDAATGAVDQPGCFVRKLQNATIEGAMAVSGKFLVAPQGRVPPLLFDVADGGSAGNLPGGGGSFLMVAADQNIYHGPGNKTGWVTVTNPENKKRPVATHKGFNACVIGKALEFRLSDHQVTAFDRQSKAQVWQAQVTTAHELVLNRDTLFVAGRNEVVALDARDGQRVWSGVVDGDAYLLAVAGGSLLVSTDAGVVHCFRPGAGKGKQRPKSDDVAGKTDSLPAASGESPAKPQELPADKRPGTVGHWAFHHGMSERAKRRGLSDAKQRVPDLAGRNDGLIGGDVNLHQAAGIEALVLDGQKNSVMLARDHKTADLPKRQITAEAWVRVDKSQTWGGIVGAMQDNGSYERGWILGYLGSKFSFAVNGTGGDNKLTYLASNSEFQPETWYHVVGTYDGTTQKIFVNGQQENSSTRQSGDIQYPPQAFFEIGAYHDKDENFKMAGMVHEVRVYSRALEPSEVAAIYRAKNASLPKPIRLAAGPYARFLDPTTAEVAWQTDEPVASALVVRTADRASRASDMQPKRNHRLQIDGLRRNRIYTYRIETGNGGSTPAFELDTTFNFTRAPVPDRPNPYTADDDGNLVADAAKSLLAQSQVNAGICVVLGAAEGRLVYELVRQSDLIVIGVEADAAKVAAARAALTRAGVYGQRATVQHVESLARLPFTGEFANLVVADQVLRMGRIVGTSKEVLRVLRPDGGLALIGQAAVAGRRVGAAALRDWCGAIPGEISDDERGVWARISRGPLPGAGEWSHLYGRADNSAFGGELLGGARGVDELRVQWIGRPGPRAQPDRNGRKPSPLSTGGRLFVQGLHRLIGLDAYNGTILWSLEIPPLERFNMPRDSSNWCTDSEHVFVAIGHDCWKINAQMGIVESITPVHPGGRKGWKYDWSYIARHEDKLIGSAVKSGSAFVKFWGKGNWYDARSGPETFQVCSDNLFARDASTGRQAWTYANGVILNSTITAAHDRVFFVECRNPKVIASESRRVGLPELWQDLHLVALDVDSGRVVWQQPIESAQGIVSYYMAHGEGKLVIAASNAKKYDVSAFDSADGASIWHREVGWLGGKGDHGKAISRPAIASGRVFVRPEVLELSTGKTIGKMPGGGCGTYALTANTAIYRNGNVTMWDSENNAASSWNRLRPGCWLSTIPAAGMLLSPEAGGGCSCGKWMETSMGFMPKR